MKYYFVSADYVDGKILYPRVPTNRMNGEDEKTERICVSQSINGCLTAIGGFDTDTTLYVYQCESSNAIQPTLEQVADACYTGEQWLLEPTTMNLFMEIIIIGTLDIPVNRVLNVPLNKMRNVLYGFKPLIKDN